MSDPITPSALTPGPDHAATQVKFPWRSVWRTMVEVGIPAFAVALIVAPQILQILAEDLGAVLPESVTAWLLGAAATITLVAGALARIFALPGVNRILDKVALSARPLSLDR